MLSRVATWGSLLRQAAEAGLRLLTQARQRERRAPARADVRDDRALRPAASLGGPGPHRPGAGPGAQDRLRPRPRRRRRPGRDRLGLGAVRGGRRAGQGPAAAGRRAERRELLGLMLSSQSRPRRRPELGRDRCRARGTGQGRRVLRPAGPGARGRRARHPPRGRGAGPEPVRPGGRGAARPVRLELTRRARVSCGCTPPRTARSGPGRRAAALSRPVSRASSARTIRSRSHRARSAPAGRWRSSMRQQAVGGEHVGQRRAARRRRRARTSRRSSTPWCSSGGGRRGPRRRASRRGPSVGGRSASASGRYSTVAHQVRLGLGVDVQQPEPARAAGDDVEAAVGQPPHVAQLGRAADVCRPAMPSSSAAPALAHGDDAELLVRHRAGDEVDGQLAVARLEDVQWQRGPRHQHRAQREQRQGLGHVAHGTAARRARRWPPGGRSTANGSVTRSVRSANRNSAAGRPPAGPGARRSPVGSSTPRRVSTRCRLVADTWWPSAAA